MYLCPWRRRRLLLLLLLLLLEYLCTRTITVCNYIVQLARQPVMTFTRTDSSTATSLRHVGQLL